MSSQAKEELYKALVEKIKLYYARPLRLEMRLVEKSPHTPPQTNKVKKRITPIYVVSIFLALIYYFLKKV